MKLLLYLVISASVLLSGCSAGSDGEFDLAGYVKAISPPLPVMSASALSGEIRPFGTPQDFGAVGNGIADDTGPINAAIANCNVVNFPATEGGYLITNSICVAKPTDITGIGAKIMLAAPAVFDVFLVGSSNVSVTGLKVYGGSSHSAAVFRIMTHLGKNLEYIRLERIRAINCNDFITDVGAPGLILNLEVIECYHNQPTGRGAYFTQALCFIFFRRFVVDYTGTTTDRVAISLYGNQGSIFENCDILGGIYPGTSHRWGFCFDHCQAVWLRRCMSDTLGGMGFWFNESQYIYLDHCTASLCDQHGFIFSHTSDVTGSGLYSGNRGVGTPNQCGFWFMNGCQRVTLGQVISKSNTGPNFLVDRSCAVSVTGLVQ